MRPRVYTRTRIMRARGRAHAPARGDKSLTCSRISYFAYAVLGLALIQGISPICCIQAKYRGFSPVFAYVRPYTVYRLYTLYLALYSPYTANTGYVPYIQAYIRDTGLYTVYGPT